MPAVADGVKRIPGDALEALVGRIFSSTGMSEPDAALLAATLVASDLRGVPSHGVLHVPGYVARLTDGGVDPRGRPTVASRKGGAIRIDGGNAMGQICASFAMRNAIGAAKTHGIAFAAVGNSNHCGAMAHYAEMATAGGLIGIALTNAMPTMAPWGGRDRILGINPIAIGIPAGDLPPFMLDISFSAVSRSKIVVHQQMNRQLDDGWALDETGRPTRDPEAALRGLLKPIGGHKGTGLAIASGILSTLLSGAAFGTGLGSLEDGAIAGADGHAFLALDVAAFEDPEVFQSQITDILDQIRRSRPAKGVSRLRYPGEGARQRALENRELGVPVSSASLKALVDVCLARGIDPEPVGMANE